MTARFVSFDGTERCTAELHEPDRYRSLQAVLERRSPCAIRGAGLSYCLASAAEGAHTVSVRHFDRILAFDADRRVVTVEPGVTVGDLTDFAVANGCYFPVLPGYPTITVGGCAGFNVHGKTQHGVGHFSDHVVSLTLWHPDRGEVRCSPTEAPDLFELTLGGMGLTGCIVAIDLHLQPLPGRSVRRVAHPVDDLDGAVHLMQELATGADALYSWNDLNRRGGRFGAGVVYEERFEPDDLPSRSRYGPMRLGGPSRRPVAAYSRPTSVVVNRLYALRERTRRATVRSVHDAAFPINGNEAYFALFGRRGLREYQLLVPHAAWADAAREVRTLLRRAAVPATLGSLKLFSGTRRHLWFRGDGVCLTVDVPAGPESLALFAALDRVAADHGALVNVAKDSRLDARTLRRLFPGADAFAAALEAFDPKRRFDSALRRRLGL